MGRLVRHQIEGPLGDECKGGKDLTGIEGERDNLVGRVVQWNQLGGRGRHGLNIPSMQQLPDRCLDLSLMAHKSVVLARELGHTDANR
jgi:hypothetical protein